MFRVGLFFFFFLNGTFLVILMEAIAIIKARNVSRFTALRINS